MNIWLAKKCAIKGMRFSVAKNQKRFASSLPIMPRFALQRQTSKSIQLDPFRATINFVDRNNCQLKYQTTGGKINLYPH